jgi:branched-subunit amino acid ABC-type transport system permease component
MAEFAQLLVNGLAAGAQLALLASGFGLVYAVRKLFNVFYGATFMLAAYAAVWLTIASGGSFLVATLGAALTAVLAALLLDGLVFQQLPPGGDTQGAYVPVSLACYVIAVAGMSLAVGSAPVALPPNIDTVSVDLPLLIISRGQLASLIGAAVVVLCALGLRRSVVGLSARAVAEDESVAAGLGISSRVVGLGATCASGVLAGAAASCFALDGAVTPNVGARAIVIGAFGVLGGTRDVIITSALVGLVIGITQHLSAPFVPGPWREPLAFAVAAAFAGLLRIAPVARPD